MNTRVVPLDQYILYRGVVDSARATIASVASAVLSKQLARLETRIAVLDLACTRAIMGNHPDRKQARLNAVKRVTVARRLSLYQGHIT
jgi:hypothetical protein